MKSRIEIPVEPLSEPRWARIERATFARLDVGRPSRISARLRRRSALAWAAAACFALVVAFGVRSATQGLPSIPTSPARISSNSTPSQIAFAGLSLELSPHSSVVLTNDPVDGVLLVLDSGTVACDVEPRPPESPLVVQSGETRVRVVGTRFTVTRLSDTARVQVDKGIVEVRSEGRSFRVLAGEKWAPQPAKSSAIEFPPASEPNPPPEPPWPDVQPDATSVPTPAKKAVIRPGTPLKAAPPSKSSKSEDATEGARRPSEGAARVRTSQELYEWAARFEVNDAARAMAIYRTLEVGDDSWAQNALFAHGRLEATLGNGAEARRLLTEYLRRFPRGANADDARTVLERLR